MKNLYEQIEYQELIQKLIDNGYEKIVNAFLLNENRSFTKKGRLNKCGVCRVLNWKTKELEDALMACKELLKNDLDEED